MKIIGVVVMAAVAASAFAGESANEPERAVDVCVQPVKGGLALYSAQAWASEVFAGIKVRIEWHSSAICLAAESAIQISFSEQTPETQRPGALAYALPYEGTHIVVFYDRVKHTAAMRGVPQLLAYVLVHEITHILQNVSRHSAAGIMKARWDGVEYLEMSRRHLGFTTDDVDLIYRGLEAREAQEADGTIVSR